MLIFCCHCTTQTNFCCKSILIRSAKCQIFGIWHTKHQKPSHMRCSKCQKIWSMWVPNLEWYEQKCYMKKLIYYYCSLSSHYFNLLFFSLLSRFSLSTVYLSFLLALFSPLSLPLSQSAIVISPPTRLAFVTIRLAYGRGGGELWCGW